MPDSWIDREELEDLVRSLPAAAKRNAKLPAAVRRAAAKRAHSETAAAPETSDPTEPAPMAGPVAAPDAPGMLETVDAVDAVDEEIPSTPAGESSMEQPEPVAWTQQAAGGVGSIFELVSDDEDDYEGNEEEESGFLESSPDAPTGATPQESAPSAFEKAAEPLLAAETVPDENLQTPEAEFAPETGLEPLFELGTETEAETGNGVGLDTDFNSKPDAGPEGDPEPEIFFEEVISEGRGREVPDFLADDEETEWIAPQPVSLSERDADRALVALAEARIRAEQSHLLRIRTPKSEVAQDSSPDPEYLIQPDPVPEFAETEEALDVNEGPDVPELPETVPKPPVSEEVEVAEEPEESSLDDRLERFGAESRERLGALEVAVCDTEGFLLYSDSDRPGESALATALLLDVSNRTSRLLGLEDSTATQVSLDGGHWRCLLRSAESSDPLFAGFVLARPLGAEEIAAWCAALAGAGEGGGSPKWRAFLAGL